MTVKTTHNVTPLSSARPGRRPRRPGSVLSYVTDDHVSVLWDEYRGLYVAVCERCCEGLDTERSDQAEDWAASHRCDPELAALLADVTTRRRAA